MTVSMRWVWGTAVLWTVFDLLSLAAGWGVGDGIIRMWSFAAALHCVAVWVSPRS